MIVLTAALVFASTPLKLDLNLGDRWASRIEQSFFPPDSKEPEDEERFTYEQHVRVTGVKTDEYDWGSRTRLVKHRFGGEDLPGVSATPDHLEKYAVRRDGVRVVNVERYASAEEFRLSRLLWVGFSSESDSWKSAWPVVENDWVTSAESSFKRIGKTSRLGRPCVLLDIRFADKDSSAPMTSSGRMEVDEVSGLLLYADLKVLNAPLPGGAEPRSLRVKYEVFELKLASK